MTKTFEQLIDESLPDLTRIGSIIKASVIDIKNGFVIVDAGLKSEAAIAIDQFRDNQGNFELEIGDEVDVTLESFGEDSGETILSREKAKRQEAWIMLENAHQNQTNIIGRVSGKVKGGFTVELNSIRAFLPGSLIDMRQVRDNVNFEGQDFEFKVIKLDQKRNNIVVSRRAVLESENSAEREELLANLKEEQEIKGIVKNLTDYGAFVDLGGIDGLLHITDMAWKRVKHPSEIVSVGDEIMVKVLKFDSEKSRVSLGLKQLGKDPWIAIARKFPENKKLQGKVTNLTDYGCFVEIEDGIEGLVHVSEMDWTNKNIHPSKVVSIGDQVDVMILEIDEKRRRISLGLKQCVENPWTKFAQDHKAGDKVKGQIKSITEFGIFIGLEGGIDGLVHVSDISWHEDDSTATKKYKKGEEVEAIVLQVDAARERISLGIKQLQQDPFNEYVANNKKNAIVTGKVTIVKPDGATVELSENVEGYIKVRDISSTEKVKDATIVLSVGDVVKAMCLNFDHKRRLVGLSMRAKDEADMKEQIKVNNNKKRSDTTALEEAFMEAKKGQNSSNDEE